MRLAHEPLPRWSIRRHPVGPGHVGLRGSLRSAVSREPTFSICVTLVALHLAALALFLPGQVSALLRMALMAGAIVGPPVLLLWYSQRGRVGRVLAAGLLGLAVMVSGLATSVPHAVLTGARASDYTGILATVAGIVLVGSAFWEALRGRRVVVKLVVGTLCVYVIAQWLIAPAINVGAITNAPRSVAAGAATLGLAGARDVNFLASDRVRLSGWYVPGRNGAAVIVLHGSHGTRSDVLTHLRMLNAAGYAVLAFDARGHGQSQGETNALGWRGARDIAGAVAFLQRQPGVDPRRIAALGLSMGAEEALRAAASGIPLSAVVAEGAGASTHRRSARIPWPQRGVHVGDMVDDARHRVGVRRDRAARPQPDSRSHPRTCPADRLECERRTCDRCGLSCANRAQCEPVVPAGHGAHRRPEHPPRGVRSADRRFPRRRPAKTLDRLRAGTTPRRLGDLRDRDRRLIAWHASQPKGGNVFAYALPVERPQQGMMRWHRLEPLQGDG